MKYLITLAMLAAATPALSADITLKLTDQEQKMMLQVLDAAARGGGIQMSAPVALILQKMQAAAAPVEAPKVEAPKK